MRCRGPTAFSALHSSTRLPPLHIRASGPGLGCCNPSPFVPHSMRRRDLRAVGGHPLSPAADPGRVQSPAISSRKSLITLHPSYQQQQTTALRIVPHSLAGRSTSVGHSTPPGSHAAAIRLAAGPTPPPPTLCTVRPLNGGWMPLRLLCSCLASPHAPLSFIPGPGMICTMLLLWATTKSPCRQAKFRVCRIGRSL